MTSPDPRTQAAESIETAIASLADALDQIDRIPAYDRSTIGFVAQALNTYLSVGEGALALLGHALRDHPDPEVARWIDGLRHIGGLMQHTVGQLIRTSAPADFPLKFDYVDLPLLMQRSCDYHRRRANQTQVQLVCRTVGDVPPAWADRVAVAVVADNLLANAVRHSPPGSEVLVQILPGPGGVVVSIRDHGPGLSAHEQARLFQRNTGTSAVSGDQSSGFGIAIAREFVERMDGRLWVESEPGHGACFSFRLPYHFDGSTKAR
ncbi:MAG TPA: HAMP domain-containing sensor histidine kinase [Vicinamibacterales bacterium]|nr:HAMP domain-containing sensor histidine kinase [Vicinamibacterales bacterium]